MKDLTTIRFAMLLITLIIITIAYAILDANGTTNSANILGSVAVGLIGVLKLPSNP